MADKPDEKEAPIKALDATDIAFLKNYGLGPYATAIKKAEADVKDVLKRVNDVCGVKESDTGLAVPSRWDLVSDKQMMQEEQPLQVRSTGSGPGMKAFLAHAKPQSMPHLSLLPCGRMRTDCVAGLWCRWRAAPRSSTPTQTRLSMSST